MSRNIYQIKDRFSSKRAIRFTVRDKSKTVIFESKRKNGLLTYETSNEGEQEAIENSDLYKKGNIERILKEASKVPVKKNIPDEELEDEEENSEDVELTEYAEVTSFQEAKEILKGEPYKVNSKSLTSREKILAKAEELGVSFPNLNSEDSQE